MGQEYKGDTIRMPDGGGADKRQPVPTAGAFDNLSSSFGRVHIYCVVTNSMAPIKRNTTDLAARTHNRIHAQSSVR